MLGLQLSHLPCITSRLAPAVNLIFYFQVVESGMPSTFKGLQPCACSTLKSGQATGPDSYLCSDFPTTPHPSLSTASLGQPPTPPKCHSIHKAQGSLPCPPIVIIYLDLREGTYYFIILFQHTTTDIFHE